MPLRTARPSIPIVAARRSVTTNAASASVDKSAVPKASQSAGPAPPTTRPPVLTDAREPVTPPPVRLKLTGLPYQSDEEPFSVSLSDESFETYELDPPPYTIEVTKKELKQMYYDMVVTRYDPPRAAC